MNTTLIVVELEGVVVEMVVSSVRKDGVVTGVGLSDIVRVN